jgi:TonB family protein
MTIRRPLGFLLSALLWLGAVHASTRSTAPSPEAHHPSAWVEIAADGSVLTLRWDEANALMQRLDADARATQMAPRQIAPERAPRYPRQSLEKGEQGLVWVELDVAADGHVRATRVARTSGFGRLDAAALEHAESLRFEAPRVDGEPQGVSWWMAYTFQVEGGAALLVPEIELPGGVMVADHLTRCVKNCPLPLVGTPGVARNDEPGVLIVQADARVDAQGRLEELRWVESDRYTARLPPAVRAWLEASARSRSFTPATLNGLPTTAETTIFFQLQEAPVQSKKPKVQLTLRHVWNGPRLSSNSGLEYPERALRTGQQGWVVVKLARRQGRQQAPELMHSSGHASLDRAALAYARRVELRPERVADRELDFVVAIPFLFHLIDRPRPAAPNLGFDGDRALVSNQVYCLEGCLATR